MKLATRVYGSIAAALGLLVALLTPGAALAAPSISISTSSGSYTSHVSSVMGFQVQTTDVFDLTNLKFLSSGDVDRVIVQALNSSTATWENLATAQTLEDGSLALGPIPNTTAGFRLQAASDVAGSVEIFAWIDADGDSSVGASEVASNIRTFSFFDSSLSGVLLDSTTGNPISNERVYARPLSGSGINTSAVSDAEGKFQIRVDNIGDYQLNYYDWSSVDSGKDNGTLRYQSKSEIVTIGESSVTDFEWQLVRYPVGTATVLGVLDQELLSANPSAYLNCNAGGQWYGYSKNITSEDGAFAFLKIPNLNCFLRVNASGFLSREYQLDLTAPSTVSATTIDLEPVGTSTLSGYVTDSESGLPVAGLTVYASYNFEGTSWGESATTDVDGLYEIQNAPTGNLKIRLEGRQEAPRYKYGAEVRLSVPTPGSSVAQDLVAQPLPSGAGQISGVVLDWKGNAVGNANVWIDGLVDGEWISAYVSSDPNTGAFNLSDLPMGTYDFRVSATNTIGFKRSVTLTEAAPSVSLSPQLQALGSGTLSGQLLNSEDGLPIANAIVGVGYSTENFEWWGSATTAADGTYIVSKIPDGIVTVHVSPPSGSQAYFYFAPVKIDVDGDTQLDLALDPYPVGTRTLDLTVSGMVAGDEGWVYLNCRYGERGVSYHQPISSGVASFSNLAALECTFNISVDGYFRVWGQADLRSSNQSLSKSLTALGANTISGTVVSENDSTKSVAGAQVNAYVEGVDYYWSANATTSADGSFTITGAPVAEVNLTVNAPEGTPRYFGSQTQKIQVSGDVSGVQIGLKPMASGPGSIEGSVVGADGNPVEDAYVSSNVRISDDEWLYVWARTDEKGRYQIAELPAGTYELNISAQGFLSRSAKVTVGTTAAGSQVTLTPEGVDTISGRLVSSADTTLGLAGVTVRAQFNDGHSRWYGNATTAEDGTFQIAKVPRGQVTLYTFEVPTGFFRFDETVIDVDGDVEVILKVDPHPTGAASYSVTVTEWLPDGQTGLPLAGVDVGLSCYFAEGDVGKQLVTDESGVVTFENLAWPTSSCEVYASKEGYQSDWDWLDSPFPTSSTLELIKNGTEQITVTILDPEGAPLADAWTSLTWKNGSRSQGWYGISNAEGFVTFDGLPSLDQGGFYSLSGLDWNLSSESWFILPPPLVFDNSGSANYEIQLGQLERGAGSISGTIFDRDSLSTVTNARVETEFWIEIDGNYNRFTAGADVAADGSFTIDGLITDRYYNLTFYSTTEQFSNINRGVWISETQSARAVDVYVDIEESFSEGFGMVSGYLVDQDDIGVEGVNVWLYSNGPGHWWDAEVRSTTDGYFEFSEVPFGEINLWIDSPIDANGRQIYRSSNFGSVRFSLNQSNSSRNGLEFGLYRYPTGTGSISGKLIDEDTQVAPVGDYAIRVTGDYSVFPGSSYVAADQNGSWSIGALPDGDYTVTFENRNGDPDSVLLLPDPISVTITGGQAVDAGTLTTTWLGDGGSKLTMTVVDSVTKEPIASAYAWITYEAAYQIHRNAETSESGAALFTNIPQGRYIVAARADGYVPIGKMTIVDVNSQEKTYRYELRPLNQLGTVSGTVTDRFGNPIPDVEVAVMWDVDYGLEGGNEGVFGYSDSSGNFVVEKVPLWSDLDLHAYVWGSGRLEQFAPYVGTVSLSDASPNPEVDIVLFEPSVLRGKVIRPDQTSNVWLYAVAKVASTGEEIGWAEVTQGGEYEFTNLPSVPLIVQLRTTELFGTKSIAVAYYKQVSSVSAIGVEFADQADVLNLSPGQTFELEQMHLELGNSVTGQVRFLAAGQPTAALPRPVKVEAYVWDGAQWVLRDDLQNVVTGYWQAGRYTITGLPDGTYKLRFSEAYPTTNPITPTFLGGDTLETAQEIVLNGGVKLELEPANVSIPQPSFSVSPISASTLSTTQKAALSSVVTPSATSGTSVELNLGLEMAGEWVAVSVEDADALAVASATFEFWTQAVTWYQVGPDGKLTVPVSSGTKNLVVQNVDGKPIGLATVTIASTPTPPAGGGGGGGGGGGAAPLATPVQLSPVYISGKFLVDQNVQAEPGTWENQQSLSFTYQWHRCRQELEKPSSADVTLYCSAIFGATNPQYQVVGADEDGFLLLEVKAKDSGNLALGEGQAFSNTLKFGETGVKPVSSEGPRDDGTMKTWAKRLPGNTEAKLYAKNIVGAGKVVFKVNGKEIAWVRAVDATDPKLRVITEGPMTGANYLVRTVKLNMGKNILEVYIDGERTTRVAYSRK